MVVKIMKVCGRILCDVVEMLLDYC